MSRIIEIKYNLNCNKWPCGRCGQGLYGGRCRLFPGIRASSPIAGYYRLPACLAADTHLTPCENGCRREGTHTDSEGISLCTVCWNALIAEAKAARGAAKG